MSGIDMAPWDVLEQSLNQPLTVLLGRTTHPVRAYNRTHRKVTNRSSKWTGGAEALNHCRDLVGFKLAN